MEYLERIAKARYFRCLSSAASNAGIKLNGSPVTSKSSILSFRVVSESLYIGSNLQTVGELDFENLRVISW